MKNEFGKKQLIVFFLVGVFSLYSLSFADTAIPTNKEEFKLDPKEIRSLYGLEKEELGGKLSSLSDSEAFPVCIFLGSMAMSEDRPKKAEDYFKLALEYTGDSSFVKDRVLVLVSLAMVKAAQDDKEQCVDYLLQAKGIIDSGIIKDEKLKINLLIELGEYYYRLGMYKDSQIVYEQAYGLAQGFEDKMILVKCQMGLAYSYMKQPIEPEKTKLLFELAGATYQEKNMIAEAAEALKCLGNLELGSDTEKAKEMYLKALDLYSQVEDDHGQANCNFNLGIAFKNEGAYTEALEYLQKAMYSYTRSGSTGGIGIVQLMMGETYTLMKEFDQAKTVLEQAAFILEKTQSWDRLGETEDAFGDLYATIGDKSKAGEYYNKAINRFNELKLPNRANKIQEKLGRLGG